MTAHTTNPVPLTMVGSDAKRLREGGKRCDMAPTLPELLGIEKPKEREGGAGGEIMVVDTLRLRGSPADLTGRGEQFILYKLYGKIHSDYPCLLDIKKIESWFQTFLLWNKIDVLWLLLFP
ncbi:MAG: hypothetical protein JW863_22080 [Chitinispirillaceae bacterium]|nr:hypothetical protein [Chitinispirillaceae bacterium]